MIISLPECTAYEGETQVNANITLDTLYASILQMAFDLGKKDPKADSKVQSIIGTIISLVNPLPPSAVAELIGLETAQVMSILKLAQSLLVLHDDPSYPVKLFHKSFSDFIINPSRCLDKRFYISPETLHHELALNCLRLMNTTLKPNLLSLPNYALNEEVEDLPERVKDHISAALEYACRSWYNHLPKTKGDTTHILNALHEFLEEKFLPWLEIASVLGAVRDAVVALEKLILWLQEVCLHLL